ncbi:M10 family metallopeptidase [Microvirga sp. M2]|uniref:M10 family metallopeptidase n=1 Tax=Microvirga sp. M2 TaxID=3073270 RepID=UPI0039C2BB71
MSRNVAFSGVRSIDALLSGFAWDQTNLTFAFPTDPNGYGINYARGENTNGFGSVNVAQQFALRDAAIYVGLYTNLTFAEGAPNELAHIRFAMSGVPSTAWAYFPSGTAQDGDIWMNPQGGATYLTPDLGNWGYATVFHEFGHALGLQHGHAENPDDPVFLSPSEDNWNYSLMTYRSYTGAQTDFVQGNLGSDNPTTYMQDDIAALQYMYGANFDANAGNTTYRWSPSTGQFTVNGVSWGTPLANKIFMTVWDGNGTDTYDLSAYGTNLTVNLQPGAFSTFSAAQVADLDRNTAYRPALGNVANARLYQGDARSLIENAVGGSGNDRITGNAARNTLTGNAGNDSLNGSSGNDILDGGSGHDVLTGGSGADIFVFKNHRPGSASYDKITDFNRSVDSYLKIDNKYMSKLGPAGHLSSSKFVLGTHAKDAGDHLIYDKAKGYLYYDPDGTGAAAKQLIVCLTNKASLAASDIYVI